MLEGQDIVEGYQVLIKATSCALQSDHLSGGTSVSLTQHVHTNVQQPKQTTVGTKGYNLPPEIESALLVAVINTGKVRPFINCSRNDFRRPRPQNAIR